MTPWKSRLAHLTMVGTLGVLAMSGCGGGGDVPDPENDALAAAEPGSARAPDPAESAPAEVAPTIGVASGAPAQQTAPAETAPVAPTEAASGAPVVPVASASDSAATNELLNLANSSGSAAPAAETAAATAAPGGLGGGPPGYPSGSGAPGAGYPGASGSGAGQQAGFPGAPGGPPAGYPGAPGGPPGAAGYPGAPGAGRSLGMPGAGLVDGGLGGLGGAGNGAADFSTPGGAAMAFLMAVQSKDRARIAQATARRAPTEASARNQEVFKVLLEESVDDDQLEELAKAFQGYQISGLQIAKNTGQRGVNLSKQGSAGESLTRTVQVRKEKEGWKVIDFTGFREFKYIPSTKPRRR